MRDADSVLLQGHEKERWELEARQAEEVAELEERQRTTAHLIELDREALVLHDSVLDCPWGQEAVDAAVKYICSARAAGSHYKFELRRHLNAELRVYARDRGNGEDGVDPQRPHLLSSSESGSASYFRRFTSKVSSSLEALGFAVTEHKCEIVGPCSVGGSVIWAGNFHFQLSAGETPSDAVVRTVTPPPDEHAEAAALEQDLEQGEAEAAALVPWM